MELALIGGLAGLALVDSTSTGTLVLPVWMLAHPRVRAARVLLHLGVLGVFYFLLGVLILLAGAALAPLWKQVGKSEVTSWAQLVLGLILLAASFWPDTPWAKRRAASGGADRRARMRDRIAGPDATPATVVTVALGAGLIEAASMLPYLAALGLLAASELSLPATLAVLAGYCLVMCLPALLLLGLRLALDTRIQPLLTRLEQWLTRLTGGAIWWVIGIIGFFLAADAATRLGLFGG